MTPTTPTPIPAPIAPTPAAAPIAQTPAPAPSTPPTQNTTTPQQTSQASPAPFAWDTFLEQVDAESAKLYILLKNQSTYSFDGSTLTITPRSGVARKTFAQSSAQATLSSCLPQGVNLSISDSPQAPAAKSAQNLPAADSSLSKISDIMGNIQEVNTNGGIPF